LIDVSTRYVPHIVALLLVAAIPTLLHSLGRFDVDDCAVPGRLLAPPDPDHAPLLSAVERQRFDRSWGAGNWSAGTLPREDHAGRLSYVIARSFDPKAVYHWPESRAVWEVRPVERRVEEIESEGVRIPVHRAYYEPEGVPPRGFVVVAYLLVYHSRPVANPYLEQILSAPRQVVTGRRPMWLFLVHGRVGVPQRREAEARATEWLASAWESYRAACTR
jgi:hypothetical protein